MPRDNIAKFIILGVLSHEPLSGYDIKKKIESSISYFWDVSFGQIYPELAKLEADECVTKQVEYDDKRPARKIYSITEKGYGLLSEWLKEPVDEEKTRYQLLVKLFFSGKEDPLLSLRSIKEFRERNIDKLAILNQYEANLREVLNQSSDHFFILLTVRLGQHVFQAHINWADESIELLNVRIQRGL